MADCMVCLQKHKQHYGSVTKKLVKSGVLFGAGAGTLFCIEGMTANNNLYWRNHSLVRNAYVVGFLTVSGAFLGSLLGEAAGILYSGADTICAALAKRKCTCLPAQPSTAYRSN